MPMTLPYSVFPNDPNFPDQWNMTRIVAGGPGHTGWDISTGDPSVVIAIIDTGCDLNHRDLRFATRLDSKGNTISGINLFTMGDSDGGTVSIPDFSSGHGTLCAGVAAAVYNNGFDVAGVAGSCAIMPLALRRVTDDEIARGMDWAADNGAKVISMSFGQFPGGHWDFDIITAAITEAHKKGCVVVAAAGNNNRGDLNQFPASSPLVIAVGGSDQLDNRKSQADPGDWGANYGPGLSVVAPKRVDHRARSPRRGRAGR
jgi:subtilisin family serine protease